MILRKFVPFLMALCGALHLGAQDWHFSQFQANPQTVSPALTGLFNGDMRVAVHYRNQWNFAAKFNTFSATADGALVTFRNDDYIAAGLQFLGDRAGDLNYGTSQGNASLAYHKSLSSRVSHYLSAGFSGGYARRSVDLSNVVAFDPEPGAGAIPTQLNFADISMGLNWYLATEENVFYYLGAGLYHLNRPRQSFISEGADRLIMRQTLYGGLSLALSPSVFLQPSAVYMVQGPHQQVNLGTSFKFWLNAEQKMYQAEKAFSVGFWYRHADALIFQTRFDYQDLNFGVSYDFNLSKLANGSNGQGGPEISVIYVLNKGRGNAGNRNQRLLCPTFF